MYAYLGWFLPAAFIASIAIWIARAATQRQLRSIWVYCGLGLLLWAAYPSGTGMGAAIALAFAELAGLTLLVVTLETVLLRRMRAPKFLSEILIAGGYVAIIFSMLAHVGLNVTGLIATSAVATAVIGLSLQDMLANFVGGVVLELEQSIKVSDWIRTDQFLGEVTAVRLRHTVVQTADNDIVLIPNSSLIRLPVTLISRKHRRLIPFRLPYGCNPARVVQEVTRELLASPINGVCDEPDPRCVVIELNPQYVEFGVFAWLNAPGKESQTISTILIRVHFALARIGTPLTAIAQTVELQRSTPTFTGMADRARYSAILRSIPILRAVPPEDIDQITPALQHVAFAPGEFVIRQDDDGDSMYVLISGSVDVHVASKSGMSEYVATLEQGQFFGEMSLLTGEKRTATVMAMDPVECLVVDKQSVLDLLRRRPELALDMSTVIADRQANLSATREKLDGEHRRQMEARSRVDVLGRIQRYFGISESGAVAK